MAALAQGLTDNSGLRVIVVIPRFPDQDGRLSLPPNLAGRAEAMRLLRRADGERVAVYGLENADRTPVYVHAKVCIVDDAWTTIGSDNFNRRSWTHDSELTCAVMDENPDAADSGRRTATFAARVRDALAAEHLGIPGGQAVPAGADLFEAFGQSASRLDQWHRNGRMGSRPPGQLRSYPDLRLSRWTRIWSAVPYRLIYDPDGRPPALRMNGGF
jgi:phosphatidylserine/phosphatidylglycerophosphate/cardiolipin synthase-like enzyme